MKKITLLIAFTAIVFTAQAQTFLVNPTFETNIDNWTILAGGTISHSSTEGANALGAMEITCPASGDGAMNTPVVTPTTAGDYLLSYKVKGVAGTKIRGQVVQQPAGTIQGLEYALQADDVWEEYNHLFTNINNSETLRIRIISRTASGAATFFVDDVSFAKVDTNTQNGFVSNQDFETGDFTGWNFAPFPSDGVAPSTATIVTDPGTNGTNVAQISYTAAETKVQELQNDVYDYGTTLGASPVSITLDVNVNTLGSNANKPIKFAINTISYDASDNQLESFFQAKTPSDINQWETISYNANLSQPFNKIQIKIRVVGDKISGDILNIDNLTAEFTSYTLGLNEVVNNNDFKLYPNPATNLVNIKSLNSISNVSIYDILGKQVLNTNKINGDVLDVSALKAGIYILKIEDDSKHVGSQKLVISR